jgi:hypothetical protein
MKRHCWGLWQSSLAVGEAQRVAVARIVGMKAGIVVVVGATKTVDVVSGVELKAAGADIGVTRTVAVAGRVELKAAADAAVAVAVVAAAADIETTKAAADVADAAAAAAAVAAGIEMTKIAVAGVLLNILRPHAGTGDTGLGQSAADCVAQRVVAGLVGAFGFVAIWGAECDFPVGNLNTVPQADMPDWDLDTKGLESDPGHQ